jgi:hypothetical protein
MKNLALQSFITVHITKSSPTITQENILKMSFKLRTVERLFESAADVEARDKYDAAVMEEREEG